jgi:hypothetical protein
MVKHLQPAALDSIFSVLTDPTSRRSGRIDPPRPHWSGTSKDIE